MLITFEKDRLGFSLKIFTHELPNELRIDAAEGGKAERKGQSAAASVRVGLSRIWKKKAGGTGKNNPGSQSPPIKDESTEYFT